MTTHQSGRPRADTRETEAPTRTRAPVPIREPLTLRERPSAPPTVDRGVVLDDAPVPAVVTGPSSTMPGERVMSARSRLVVAALVYVILILAVVGFALDLHPLRAVAVSLFLLVAVGAAPVLLLRPMAPTWFALLTVTTSLVTTVALGFTMSVFHWWHPVTMFGVVAVIAVALLALAVLRDWRRLPG